MSHGRCRYNFLHTDSAERPQGWDFFSTRNQDGAVTVLEGPATHPERPPEPPLAVVYADLPGPAAINFRARVTGGTGTPGGSGTPVEVYAAADVEYTGLLLAIDFDERYLRLDRVDRHIQPGATMIDRQPRPRGRGRHGREPRLCHQHLRR